MAWELLLCRDEMAWYETGVLHLCFHGDIPKGTEQYEDDGVSNAASSVRTRRRFASIIA